MKIRCTKERFISNKVEVHGHRGARRNLAENTVAAFEYAIRAGVDAVEMDLVLWNGAIFLSHDPVVAPGALPYLSDALALADSGKFYFNLDMKVFADEEVEAFIRLVLNEIKPRGLRDRVMLQSFHFGFLQALRRADDAVRTAAIVEQDKRDFAAIAREAGSNGVTAYLNLVTPEKVAAAHRARVKVLAWTANTPAEWDRLLEAEVDAIITDDPAALIAYLKR